MQQAREAARRVQCKNNMRQIGLAVHNYQSALGSFPPGVLGTSGSKKKNHPLHTWQAMILHYLRRTQGPFAPRRACSVEAMIEFGARRRPIIRSTEQSSAGADLACGPAQ